MKNGYGPSGAKPLIVFTKHSPCLVAGLKDFTNSRGEKLEVRPVMSLCRCGQSKERPYCDGSHSAAGFAGEKEDCRAPDSLRDYRGRDIIVHFNLGVCSHSGICVKGLPNVFDVNKKPWINADGAGARDIIAIIERCPSGALSYTTGTERRGEIEREPAIRVDRNGPLEISGGIILLDDMESKPELAEHYTLCRCGRTKNSPFCDGNHISCRFWDDKN